MNFEKKKYIFIIFCKGQEEIVKIIEKTKAKRI